MSNSETKNIIAVSKAENSKEVRKKAIAMSYLESRRNKLGDKMYQQPGGTADLTVPEVFLEKPQFEKLSDEQVIELTNYKMLDEIQEALEELLEQKQEGVLSLLGQIALDQIMEAYDEGLLIKSEALRVAVERGLIEPLSK